MSRNKLEYLKSELNYHTMGVEEEHGLEEGALRHVVYDILDVVIDITEGNYEKARAILINYVAPEVELLIDELFKKGE